MKSKKKKKKTKSGLLVAHNMCPCCGEELYAEVKGDEIYMALVELIRHANDGGRPIDFSWYPGLTRAEYIADAECSH